MQKGAGTSLVSAPFLFFRCNIKFTVLFLKILNILTN